METKCIDYKELLIELATDCQMVFPLYHAENYLNKKVVIQLLPSPLLSFSK